MRCHTRRHATLRSRGPLLLLAGGILTACAATRTTRGPTASTPAAPPDQTVAPAAADQPAVPQARPLSTPQPADWQSSLLRDHPLVGRIVDLHSGQALSAQALEQALASAPVLVLGEQHDNPDHHRLQARIVEALARHGRRPPVVFEQLERSQQAVVDAYLKQHPDDVDGLSKVLHWSESGWPPWPQYRPIFQAAITYGGGVRAGSMDRQTTRALSREGLGALDPELVQRFGLAEELAPEQAAALAKEMQEAHCGMLPDAMLGPMVLVQRARDASLAAAVQSAAAPGAVLITGNGHARTDRGVPSYLQRAGGPQSVSLALLEVRPDAVRSEDYAAAYDAATLPFDFVWFTPVGNDEDHCEALRARFHKPTP